VSKLTKQDKLDVLLEITDVIFPELRKIYEKRIRDAEENIGILYRRVDGIKQGYMPLETKLVDGKKVKVYRCPLCQHEWEAE